MLEFFVKRLDMSVEIVSFDTLENFKKWFDTQDEFCAYMPALDCLYNETLN